MYDCVAVDGDEDIQKLNLLRRLQSAKKLVTEPLARLREIQQRQAPDANAGDCQLAYGYTDGVDCLSAPVSGGLDPNMPPMEIYLKARAHARSLGASNLLRLG